MGLVAPRHVGSSWIRDQTCVSCILSQIPFYWTIGKARNTLLIDLLLFFISGQSLSRVWLCDPMNRSTLGLPVHHQLLEFTHTHVHRVGDGIEPPRPLLSPSPPAPNPPQHQVLLQWVNLARGGQSTWVSESASVFPMNTPEKSLGWTDWISLQSKGLSRVFSNTTVQKYQFLGTQLSSQSNSHIHTWPLEKP